MTNKYQPQEFEKKWVDVWEKEKTYKSKTQNPSFAKASEGRQKSYVLAMFPYPSGAGLHVGHVRNYTGTDVVARYFRMNGHSVLHPMGWDAFGLPAENAAVKAKKNPMDMVPEHIATFKKQMKSLGFSYDWDREFTTTDPNYYKWTQWLFIQFYKMGLLYKKNIPINYCPSCKTGLAEEEVLPNGTHERCGNKIEKRDLPQWVFKITKYADRLLSDLEGLDWPKGILDMQRNWIGRSEGVNLEFKIENSESKIKVFTTAIDTIFGVTFMVLSSENPLVVELKSKKSKEVEEYIKKAKNKTEIERRDEGKEKTGVFTGFYCINPLNSKKVPIWIADYVLMGYGTGAVMGVPGHDSRDYQFAIKYKLEIKPVVKPTDVNVKVKTDGFWNYEEIKLKYFDKSILFDSGKYDGLTSLEAKNKLIEYIEKNNIGKKTVIYHLRDWIFSRQRYWGEPIPMVNCEKCGWNPIPESELPLKLPYVKSYEPTETGESPLSVISEFVNTTCPNCGGKAKRETDTMPNWAGSCWYFIAFAFWNQEARQMSSLPSINNWRLQISNSGNWLPVDWYLGGAEHAVLHLLYSRFWVKALYDLKLLNFKEPFLRLRNQGMILAEDHRKMSKSFGNVINPDNVIKEFGADALRIYEMFMAPFNQEISWATKSLQGSYRFVKRIWDLFQQYNNETMKQSNNEDKQLVVKLQKTIQKVTSDIPEVKFNTSIAAMMGFLNEWEESIRGHSGKAEGRIQNLDSGVASLPRMTLSTKHAKQFLQILAPFAPFITEEIWHTVFGEKESIHLSSWPTVSGEIIEEEIIIPIQVNGKLRSTLRVSRNEISKDMVEKKALEDKQVIKYLESKEYKVIYVPGKIINFIVK